MSPTNKPGTSSTDRKPVDVSVWPAQLTETEPILASEELGSRQDVPLSRRKQLAWGRGFSMAILGFGLLSAVLLVLHEAGANHQQLNSSQASDKSSLLKSQSISLSNLGLQPVNTLSQLNALTVNGNVNVEGSVVLNPSPTPVSAVAGQLYFDQLKNQLGYYNGGSFVYLQGGPGGNNISNVNNVYNVNNVSNVSNISNFTNAATGPPGVIPMFDGSGLTDSILNQNGNGVAVGATANTTTRFTVTGATSDNTTSALTVTNSKGDAIGQFGDGGQVDLGIGPGATFGNTNIGTNVDGGINNIVSADRFRTSGALTITALTEYVGSVASAPFNQYQFAIYADSGGAPGAWVASSSVGTLTANDWNSLPISATLAANTSYWFAYTTTSNNASQDDPYFTLTASPTHAYASFTFGTGPESGMPATFPTPTTVNDFTHSVYTSTLGTNPEVVIDAGGTFTDTGPAVFQDTNNSMAAFQVQNGSGVDALNVDTLDNNVGIGTGTPTAARLSIVGATNDNTSKALSVTSSAGTSLAQVGDDGTVSLGESRPAFGNNSSGNYTGAGYFNSGFELLNAQSFTTTSGGGGAISSMSTYIGQAISGTNNLYQMAIYSDSSNAPHTIIASTAVGTLTSTGWNTLPISANLAPSTKYWLVYWTNVTDGNHNGQNFISGYSGPNAFYQGFAVWQSGGSNGMPTTFPSASASGNTYETCIYATYANPVSALTLDSSGNLTEVGNALIQSSSSSALDVTDATGSTALYVDGGSHYVGVNTSNTGGYNFVVQGTSAFGGTNTTAALKVTNASAQALFTADTTNNALVLGNDGAPANLTVRGGAASGNNVGGGNITFDASNGTGAGGSGSFNFRTAKPSGNVIGVDNTGSTIIGGTNTVTLSFTTGNQPNRLLLVTVITATGATYTSVTYDGIALTQLATKDNNVHVEMWYLVNPPSGTYNIVATKTNTFGNLIGASTFYNVDQTTPFGTVATASGTSVTSSLSVASASASQLVVDGIGTDGNDPTNTVGQTQLWNQPPSGGNWPAAAAYKQGTGGTVNMSWTVNSSDWADIGVPINPTSNTTQDSLTSSLMIADTGNVGIDNTNPQYSLDVSGTARLQTTTNSTTAFQIQNSAGTPLFIADTSGMAITIAGTATTFATLVLSNAHFSSTQTTAPTISTPLNCGTSPSAAVTVGATDSAGSFTLTAGTGTVTGPCSTTITFNKAYGSTPKSVIITPTTAIGSSPQGKMAVVSATSANSFTVTLGTNPAASEVNAYYYWVVQ
jgi:hypothetical protein